MDIQNTKEALSLVAGLIVAAKQAKENDGKIDSGDLVLLYSSLPKVLPAIQGAEDIPAEIKDLDEKEVGVLVEVLRADLGEALPADAVATIEDTITILQASHRIYSRHFD